MAVIFNLDIWLGARTDGLVNGLAKASDKTKEFATDVAKNFKGPPKPPALSLDASDYIKNSALARKETAELTRAINGARTPAENFAKSIALLDKALKEGTIDLPLYNRLVAEAGNKMDGAGKKGNAWVATLGKMAMAYVGINAIKSQITDSISLAADAEQSAVAFRVLLKDASAAQAMLGSLREFAAATPFQFPEIRDAGQMLLAFGYSANEVTKQLEVLGNIASGTNTPLGQLAELMGKNRVQGVINTADLNQLGGRGINVLDGLAKRFGVNTVEVRKLASEGKIAFADLQAAMEELSATDFAGLMGEQSKTLNGQLSTLQDTFGQIKTDIGEGLIPVLKSMTETAQPFARQFGTGLKELHGIFSNLNESGEGLSAATIAKMDQSTADIEEQKVYLAQMLAARKELRQLDADLAAGNLKQPEYDLKLEALKKSAPGELQGRKLPPPDTSATEAAAELDKAAAKEQEKKEKAAKKAAEAEATAAATRLQQLREEVEALRHGAEAAKQMRLKSKLDPTQLAEFEKLIQAKKELEDDKAGAALRELMQTPMESLTKQIADYKHLLDVGAINQQTFDRASKEAADKFQQTQPKEATAQPPSFGALQKGSVEAFSAALRNERAGAQTKLQVEGNKLLGLINGNLERMAAVGGQTIGSAG